MEPLGVHLPSQLLTSPYLALQREQRKRKEEGSQGKGRKRKTAKDLYNRLAAMSLLVVWGSLN